MASTFLLFQVASVSALVGMTLGWRGVMTRYSGFYDLPTAWSNVFWGILIGGFYGSLTHNFIVVPYLEMVTNNQAAVSIHSICSYSVFLHRLQFTCFFDETVSERAAHNLPVDGHWVLRWAECSPWYSSCEFLRCLNLTSRWSSLYCVWLFSGLDVKPLSHRSKVTSCCKENAGAPSSVELFGAVHMSLCLLLLWSMFPLGSSSSPPPSSLIGLRNHGSGIPYPRKVRKDFERSGLEMHVKNLPEIPRIQLL